MFEAKAIPANTRDITAQLDDGRGRPRSMSAEFYRTETTQNERSAYCVRNASYILPTHELIGFLRYVIGDRKAIEIGSGNGALASALGIQGTDSHQQQQPTVVSFYQMMQTPTVRYGADVDRIDALGAIAKYRPKVVIGAWVTHLYDERYHALGGNEDGINEERVIDQCETYLMIGNRQVHRNKPIWQLPHRIIEPIWLYSRAFNGAPDFVACWGNAERFAG